MEGLLSVERAGDVDGVVVSQTEKENPETVEIDRKRQTSCAGA